ncbi:carbonic anhydrase [Planctopirus limnophila DSM 3776]|uniref:Carbonic anhydrase n=2 Tax=Planctopirus limnophila TaxID=120 RepID=D5SQS7_PLAL2|nr:carbonic anhydrase [Planctopirus limnophila DSM 3776]
MQGCHSSPPRKVLKMDLIYRYDPYAPVTPRQIPTTEAAVNHLLEGNSRFIQFVRQMQKHTLDPSLKDPIVMPISPVAMGLPLFEGAVLTQAPFAVVLGCSDARVPTEQIFDQSFNDLFVLRIAGNVLGSECLGSLHYAVKALGESLKVVVVMGHSKCGAVTAAVDTYLSPEGYADIAYTFPLRTLVDQIQIAVRGAARTLEQYSPIFQHNPELHRSFLVAVTSYINSSITALELQRELKLRVKNPPQVKFGIYDFDSLRVQALPLESGAAPQLRDAPTSPEELSQYSSEVVEALFNLPDEERDSCRLTMKL